MSVGSLVVIGAVEPIVRARLEAGGWQLCAPGPALEDELVLVAFDDPMGRGWMAAAGHSLVIALIPNGADPAMVDEALSLGALDVVAVDDPTLALTLQVSSRQAAVWRGRQRRDAVGLQRAWDELASTRDLLSRVVDTAPVAVIAFDVQQRIVLFNTVAEAMLGVDGGVARQQLRMDDLYVEDREGIPVGERLRGALHGAVRGLRVELRTRTGERVPAALSAAEVYASDGQLRASVHLLVDLRHNQALEARADRAAQDLVEGEQRAEQLAAALRPLRDLSQPLAALTGIIDLLLLEDLSPRAQRWVERALPALDQLAAGLRVVHDLMPPRSRAGSRGHRPAEPPA